VNRDEGLTRIASVGARSPDAVRLARVASLAVRVEPFLLRRLRLHLLRDADVGAEADLWFSLLVESRGLDAIVIHRDVAAILREELKGYDRFGEIVSILTDAHRDAPPTIVLEERINALAIEKGDGAIADIDRDLRAAIVAMRESDARAREIARWFLRASPRLHPVVQTCPNAVALLLASSLLLGRRSGQDVRETKTSLAAIGWMVPKAALDTRIEIGVERLPEALRFVEIADAAPAAGGRTPSMARLSIPRPEPRLVEVTWQDAGTHEQRVVEALPGRTVLLGPTATDLRIVTLAGDEYELVPSAGEPTATADAGIDLAPYRAIVDACLPVKTLSEPHVFGVAVRVHPEYLFTAREPFGRENAVAIVDQSHDVESPVLSGSEGDALVAVKSHLGGGRSVSVTTPPFSAAQKEDEGSFEASAQAAIVIGYDGDAFRGVEGETIIDDLDNSDFRVLLRRAQPWFTRLVGGPVIMERRVRGIVTAVHLPRLGETATLSVAGADRIRDLLARVLETEQRSAQVEPSTKQATVPPDPAVADWLRDVCVAIRVPGDDGALATGLVISDRLIVSSAQRLRSATTVTIALGDRSIEARVLDPGTQGPLVYLGVASGNSFGHHAPLIRPSVRVRRPDDPPDPPDAMLVTARDGLRMLRIANAASAGVVKARDPSGYRFEVVVSDRIVPFADFQDAVLVWGDSVAGVVVPKALETNAAQFRFSSNQPVTRITADVISVNVIREASTGATALLEKQEPQTRLRAWVGSVTGDLHDHANHVREWLQSHDIVNDGIMGPGARAEAEKLAAESDLFVLIVGDRLVTMKGLEESLTQFEYGVARRAGIDILVFLESHDSNIEDVPFRSWREELKREHPVQFFTTFDSFRDAFDETVARWQVDREKRKAPSASNATESPEYRLAKVVVCGPAYGGKSSVLPRIPHIQMDRQRGNIRGVLWVERSDAAPPVSAGVAFVESSSDDNWPLGLDLDDASLVVVAVAFETEIEAVTRGQVNRIRSAHATVPILTALSHMDVSPEDVKSVLKLLSNIPEVAGAYAVSGEGAAPMNALVDGILAHIRWPDMPHMTRSDFEQARAMGSRFFDTESHETGTRLSIVSRPPWQEALARLLGERSFPDEDLLIVHPASYQTFVLGILDRAHKRPQGLPAVKLSEVRDGTFDSKIEPALVARAVANDLVRRGMAIIVEKTTEPTVFVVSLLESALGPSLPSDAQPVCRAQWTGSAREVFLELLAHYAYGEAGAIVEAAWHSNLYRGSARFGNDPRTYVEAIQTGEIAEIFVSVETRSEFGVERLASDVRQTLETILSGNASATIDNRGRGFA